jgi:hypothetical protein
MSHRPWADQETEDLARRNADNAKPALGEWLTVNTDDHAVEWIPTRWREIRSTSLRCRQAPTRRHDPPPVPFRRSRRRRSRLEEDSLDVLE